MNQFYTFKNLNFLKKKDNIFVHSNLLNLMTLIKKKRIEFNPDKLIDSIKKKIGKNGTVVFPTYNFDFCKKKNFNSRNTSVTTGFLSKCALKRKDFKRSRHPIISFAISGKLQKKICRIDSSSAFGNKSIFNFMIKNNFKNLFIDIDYRNSFTFLHHFEEICNVNYRYKKKFRGKYKYGDEKTKIKTTGCLQT